ncbi:hypothetical protein HK102_005503 [Quaeritorhiza haematococci]|nr:hypothetical protein HK102_005503 [Quaeritorhiza haematococci]
MINLQGGKFGDSGDNVDFKVVDGRVEINVAGPGDNFWFFTSDNTPDNPCIDLSPYEALAFDLQAPATADIQITFTQKLADCTTRGADAIYVPLARFCGGFDGTTKQCTIPFKTTFSKNINGTDYDFIHHKDVTLVDIKPVGTTIFVDNIRWLGQGCSANSTAGTATSTATATASPNTPPRSAPPSSQTGTSGAKTLALGGSGLVAVVVGLAGFIAASL